MHKVLDFSLNINPQTIKDYLNKENQLSNTDIILKLKLEEELIKVLSSSIVSFSCFLDEEDNTVKIIPALFNGKSIINNTDLVLENDRVV